MTDAEFEKDFCQLISEIPDLSHRVFLLLTIRDQPMQCQAVAEKMCHALYEQGEPRRTAGLNTRKAKGRVVKAK